MNNQHFISIGVSHWKSPIEIREKFSISRDQSENLIKEAIELGTHSVFTISTCNRTQIFARKGNIHELKKLLIKHTKGTTKEFEKYGFTLKNDEAIDQLFKVSTGLDSQILGDLQIFSQVKEGVNQAKKNGSIDSVTDRLLQFVFQANKEAQSSTNISKGAASLAHAAVLYIRNEFNQINNKKILLYGAGKIGERTLENLTNYKFSKITIINRTLRKAEILAKKNQVNFAEIKDLNKEILLADIIMVATNSKKPTINTTHLPLNTNEKLFLDLSVPRNIDTKIKISKNIKLIDIDQLNQVADDTLSKRKKDIPKVKTIINLHKMEFNDWCKMHELGPTIKALNLAFEKEKKEEIKRHKNQYTTEEITRLEPLMNSILKRISSKNIEYLRKRYRHNKDILEIIQEIYKINAN